MTAPPAILKLFVVIKDFQTALSGAQKKLMIMLVLCRWRPSHRRQRQCICIEKKPELAQFSNDFHEADFFVNAKICASNTEHASLILVGAFVMTMNRECGNTVHSTVHCSGVPFLATGFPKCIAFDNNQSSIHCTKYLFSEVTRNTPCHVSVFLFLSVECVSLLTVKFTVRDSLKKKKTTVT